MLPKVKTQTNSTLWGNLFAITTVIAYLYVFMEWLFMITKPSSSMSMLGFPKKVEVFLLTASLLAAGCCLLLLVLMGLGFLPILHRRQKVMMVMGALIPAGILASISLLMVDNFSYTIFHYGIVLAEGYVRMWYGLGFLIVFAFCFRFVLKILDSGRLKVESQISRKLGYVILIGIVFLSFIIPVTINDFGYRENGFATNQTEKKPHIFYITADGVNATHVSVYGYERDTTPRIRQLAETSLVAENAFPNAANTTGSLTSTFTSKYPIKMRLLGPSNILKDENAYQHLPGILRAQGYYAVQMSIPYYGDAYTINLLNAFDKANGRDMDVSAQLININQYMPTDFAYFIYEIGNRLIDRLCHIFYIKTMTNPYHLVTDATDNTVDQTKINDAIKLIQKSNKPLFVHIHIMGTHGAQFYPTNQVFSAGQDYDTQESWNVDFYDDSILNFDRQVGEIIEALNSKNMLDQSILIIGSDHGQNNSTTKRIPLIIHFPDGQHAGRIVSNVQNMDIAPTILDYLGINIPTWMQGRSLLEANLSQRLIFSDRSTLAETGNTDKFFSEQVSYNNQFWNIHLIYCQKWYSLDLKSFEWKNGVIEGYISPCREKDLITNAEAFRLILNHLKENGFDVSSLDDQYEKLSPSGQ